MEAPDENPVCSLHGKRRTVKNMQPDGEGGFHCRAGQECGGAKKRQAAAMSQQQMQQQDARGSAAGEDMFGEDWDWDWDGDVETPEDLMWTMMGAMMMSTMMKGYEKGAGKGKKGKGAAAALADMFGEEEEEVPMSKKARKEANRLAANPPVPGIWKNTAGYVGRVACKFFALGDCQWGSECSFKHDVDDTTKKNIQIAELTRASARMCKFHLSGTCTKGANCTFAHNTADLGADPAAYGISMAEFLPLQAAGEAAQKMKMGEQIVQGRVRVFDMERKHGFIASEAVHAVSGHEIYVHQSVLSMANVGPGDTVLFFMHWSAKGLPQAAAPLIRIASESFALKGTFRKVVGQDYGFIDCPILKTVFGKDTYVDKRWASLLDQGDVLAFNASINKDGTPFFEMGQPCETDWDPTAGDLSVTHTSSDVPALQVVKGTHQMQAQCPDMIDGRPQGMLRGIYGGIVKSYSKANGFGFIHSMPVKEQFGFDVHFQGDLIGDQGAFSIQSGDVVRFELTPQLRAGGKPQALTCARANMMAYKMPKKEGETDLLAYVENMMDDDDRPLRRPQTFGEPKMGKIKSYNSGNDYGFIECAELKQEYGMDVYCPGEYLRDKKKGQQVMFDVALNKKGQPQAVDVRCVDHNGVQTEPPPNLPKLNWPTFGTLMKPAEIPGIPPFR